MFLLAQAITGPLDWLSPLDELGKTGLLGMLLALTIWTIRKLYLDLGKERDSHLVDTKAMTDLIKQSTEATTKWTASQDERNKALEDMATALSRITLLVQQK